MYPQPCPGRRTEPAQAAAAVTALPGSLREAPGYLSALPPLLFALPRDPQPHVEAGHGGQHRLPAPACCKHYGPQHTWISRCSSR